MTEAPSTQAEGAARVSIIIKALNEERRIARAIESSLRALERVGGEVILADSCSTDQTIDIAKCYPIKIVQLSNPAERCCGVGPQLGYQHSCGEYVYILDGDMDLRADFIDQAVQFLDTHPTVAGVGGRVVEHNLDSLEYKARVERNAHHMSAGPVDRLDMGGLYRRAAIDEAGYFSDRNLHSYEEFDLAIRLRACGWELARLASDAVDHFGHDTPPYQLLFRRWKTKYIFGIGEIFRASIGKPHFRILIGQLKELKLYFSIMVWIIVFCGLTTVATYTLNGGVVIGLLACSLSILPIAIVMAIRKRSLSKVAYAMTSLILHCLALIYGVLIQRKNPFQRIESNIIKNNVPGDKYPPCVEA